MSALSHTKRFLDELLVIQTSHRLTRHTSNECGRIVLLASKNFLHIHLNVYVGIVKFRSAQFVSQHT